MLSETQHQGFKRLLEARIAELDHTLAVAGREAREGTVKHPDPADQAASEYERQALVHKAATARQMLKNLTQALERMRQGSFGECADLTEVTKRNVQSLIGNNTLASVSNWADEIRPERDETFDWHFVDIPKNA